MVSKPIIIAVILHFDYFKAYNGTNSFSLKAFCLVQMDRPHSESTSSQVAKNRFLTDQWPSSYIVELYNSNVIMLNDVSNSSYAVIWLAFFIGDSTVLILLSTL